MKVVLRRRDDRRASSDKAFRTRLTIAEAAQQRFDVAADARENGKLNRG